MQYNEIVRGARWPIVDIRPRISRAPSRARRHSRPRTRECKYKNKDTDRNYIDSSAAPDSYLLTFQARCARSANRERTDPAGRGRSRRGAATARAEILISRAGAGCQLCYVLIAMLLFTYLDSDSIRAAPVRNPAFLSIVVL